MFNAVIFDINDPEASITTIPSNGSWISGTGKVYISGGASDASGVKSITMKLNNGTENTVPVANPWTYELNCSDLDENDNSATDVHTLVLKVTDVCEKTTTVERPFKLDKTTPKIDSLTVKNATYGAYTQTITAVKASGIAYDGVQTGYRPVTVTVSAKNAAGENVALDGTSNNVTISTASSKRL